MWEPRRLRALWAFTACYRIALPYVTHENRKNRCVYTSVFRRRFVKSKSELRYDWRFTANQFVLASSPSRLTTRDFFFQLISCGNSPYVTPFLTRRWVCLLWICLASRQVYISHRFSPLMFKLQTKDSQNLRYRTVEFLYAYKILAPHRLHCV
jgi:hypothetical protein